MASAIIVTNPIQGTPTTQSVRDNFALASQEITALQNRGGTAANPLSIAHGGTGATSAANALAALGIPAGGNNTTFLRGDLQWATPPSGNGSGGGVVNQVNVTAPITGGGSAATVTLGMTSPLPLANGGTGHSASNLAALQTYLGIGSSSGFDGGPVATNLQVRNADPILAVERGTAFPTNLQTLGRIQLNGWTAANTWQSGAVISAQAVGNWSASSRSTSVTIEVTNGTDPRQSIRCNENGGVSIGNAAGTAPGNGELHCTGIRIGGNTLLQWLANQPNPWS
jgi:hypothetical protein